jgi:hypothetical protein
MASPHEALKLLYRCFPRRNHRVVTSPLPYQSPGSAILTKQRNHVLIARRSSFVSPFALRRFDVHEHRRRLSSAELARKFERFIEWELELSLRSVYEYGEADHLVPNLGARSEFR